MKKIVAAAALALFGLAPPIGSACDYQDGSSASAKAPAQNAVKPVAVKVKRASDQKVASTTN